MKYTRATGEDVDDLLADAPEALIHELWKFGAGTPRQALLESVRQTDWVISVRDEYGRILAIVGISSDLVWSSCSIWCCVSREMQRNKRFFLKKSLSIIDKIGEVFGRATAMIDPDFSENLRWMRWMGFRPVEEGSFGLMGATLQIWEKKWE